MQNSIDRQRLLSRYGQTPGNPATVIAKCAAGIVILVLILLISLHAPESEFGTQASGGSAPVTDFSVRYPPPAAGSANP